MIVIGLKELVRDMLTKFKMGDTTENSINKILSFNLEESKLARIIGYLIGDGYMKIMKTKKKNIYRIEFYSKYKQDLKKVRYDIFTITSYNGSMFYRERKRSWHLSYDSKTMFLLFSLLGAPVGDKAKIKFSVPEFVKRGEADIQKEFLSGLFSAEMGKPGARSPKKERTLKPIQMEMRKILEFENNLVKFFEELKKMLEIFDVTAKIYRRRRKYRRKDGFLTVTYVLSINDIRSIKNFLTKIGYAYNIKRQAISERVLTYIKLKEQTLKRRRELASQALIEFQRGLTPPEVIRKLGVEPEHKRLIQELYKKYNKGEKIDISKIRINRKNFPKITEFVSHIK